MCYETLVAVARGLDKAAVRYLVVGGLAVNAHGYVRMTADLDLMLSLDEPNLSAAVPVLEQLGYVPRAPVPLADFIDAERRAQWAREKGLTVFSLFSGRSPETEIDIFVENPVDFGVAYARRTSFAIAPDTVLPVCSLQDLLEMKRKAGRPRDLDDIQTLRQLHGM